MRLFYDRQVYEFLGQKKYTDPNYDLIAKIRERMKNNKNVLIAIVGDTGSGKSWGSLRLAEVVTANEETEELDETKFNIENVAFNGIQFKKLINKEEESLKPGSATIVEEAGVNIASRRWWENFGTNAILQTFRHRRLFTILNLPHLKFLDEQAKTMLNGCFMMTGNIDQANNTSTMSPYFFNVNPLSGFKKTGFLILNNALISEITVNMPSLKLRRVYEERMKDYKNNLAKQEMYKELAQKKVVKKIERIKRELTSISGNTSEGED